jgi:uncharacterized small protein (DUF1192 family)
VEVKRRGGKLQHEVKRRRVERKKKGISTKNKEVKIRLI